MRATVTAWLLLWAIYLAVLGDVRAGDVVGGAMAAAAILAACRPFLAGTRQAGTGRAAVRVHLRAVPGLVAATIVEVVTGALTVARIVFAASPRARPGIVEIPIPETSAAGLTTLALALTLSPGSVVVDIDRRRRVMLVHVVDARDPATIRARLTDFDRRWRRPAVE